MTFVGASRTTFQTSGTATTPLTYSTPTSTTTQPPLRQTAVAASQADQDEGHIAQWLRAEEARKYEGGWVLLDDNLQVLDTAISPSELLTRHPELTSPRIVFVERSGTQLAV
jgi:hypothetical protein